jgi:hypothetical protein
MSPPELPDSGLARRIEKLDFANLNIVEDQVRRDRDDLNKDVLAPKP